MDQVSITFAEADKEGVGRGWGSLGTFLEGFLVELQCLSWKSLLEISIGKLSWETILDFFLEVSLGNLSWKSLFEIYLANFSWKYFLGIYLGKVSWGTILEIPLGKLY